MAAARGQTVQGLVGNLVAQFLEKEDARPPALELVIGKLRAHAGRLREAGVIGLWAFGSVVRGEAVAGSDIDLFAEFDPAARLSLVGLASLRAELTDLLGAPADLVERNALRPAIRDAAERDAVRVI